MMEERTVDDALKKQIEEAIGAPTGGAVARSRGRIAAWFEGEAPLVVWDGVESPLGVIYLAASREGVCSVMWGVPEAAFLASLDPLARTERRPEALAAPAAQLRAYFEQPAQRFDVAVDLSATTPFQRKALQLIRAIPAGSVWTYKQVAEALGRPTASRAVGQAMARNPVPLIIPCHRVVGSGGSLTGYGGGGGIATKRRLLQLEGALGA